jgi:hypothetical protein
MAKSQIFFVLKYLALVSRNHHFIINFPSYRTSRRGDRIFFNIFLIHYERVIFLGKKLTTWDGFVRYEFRSGGWCVSFRMV